MSGNVPRLSLANRLDRRFRENQSGKRKTVVVIRERNGNSLPAVFRTEGQALSFVRSRIAFQTGFQHVLPPQTDKKTGMSLPAIPALEVIRSSFT
jgi:hypothetical protein